MEYNGLWDRLTVDEEKMDTIRKDWIEGKVPDLPFVIIDQEKLKEHISEKLSNIAGQRMVTTIIKAQYGDGKTNVLKYLSLYLSIIKICVFFCFIAVQMLNKLTFGYIYFSSCKTIV